MTDIKGKYNARGKLQRLATCEWTEYVAEWAEYDVEWAENDVEWAEFVAEWAGSEFNGNFSSFRLGLVGGGLISM